RDRPPETQAAGTGASSPSAAVMAAPTGVTTPPLVLAGKPASFAAGAGQKAPTSAVFTPPLLWVTLVGIVLATTPVIGGWGTANWMTPWAEKAGSAALRADVLQARAITGIVGSLLGGWIASTVGRRTTYFVVSLLSLLIAQ